MQLSVVLNTSLASIYILLLNAAYGLMSVAEITRHCLFVPQNYCGHYLMTENEKKTLSNTVEDMFIFAYSGYVDFGLPYDELNPIHCVGRGHDHGDYNNINVNDALGDYLLTLVDSLDTLLVMGKTQQFQDAVSYVVHNLKFDHDVRVQVFEATIRLIGGLLSTHLLLTDERQPFGDICPPDYESQLLSLAHTLANRMLASFDSPSGIPYPRFFLKTGRKDNKTTEACLAGAGSLLIEFGCLSALVGDPTYASIARQVVKNLWNRRSTQTGLLGSTIDVNTGMWLNRMTGIGAGHDSFYEYLHKAYVLFGDEQLEDMFTEALSSLRYYLRDGHHSHQEALTSESDHHQLKDGACSTKFNETAIYWNVDMETGKRVNSWVDSLQAAWPGLLADYGELSDAICQHAIHYFIWSRYDLPPERYDIINEAPVVNFYPLRPEFAESTYLLYRATKHPFYLHVGKQIVESLKKHTRAKCGFATIHDVLDKSQEDRMESFFLSETLKYLYLLFDENNPVNRNEIDFVFSTQAHLLPLSRIKSLVDRLNPNPFREHFTVKNSLHLTDYNRNCPVVNLTNSRFPLERAVWTKVAKFVNSKLNTFYE